MQELKNEAGCYSFSWYSD